MTTASLATIKYAEAVPGVITKGMALALSLMSSAMVFILFVSTLLHAFVWRTLFPNDLAIAITKNKVGGGGGNPQRAREKKTGGGGKSNDGGVKRWTQQQQQEQPLPVPLIPSLNKRSSPMGQD